jgi:hypothetical protein
MIKKKYVRKRLDDCIGKCEFRTGCATCDNKIKQRTERNPKRRATEELRIKDNEYHRMQRLKRENTTSGKSEESAHSANRSSFPPEIDEQVILDLIKKASEKMKLTNFEKVKCKACYRLQLSKSAKQSDFAELPEDLQKILESDGVDPKEAVIVCKECSKHGSLLDCPFSVTNGLHFGKMPQELAGLTLLEEMLISRIRCRLLVCKLKVENQRNDALCQKAIKGNIIAFPQDTGSVNAAISLPHSRRDIPEILKVIFCGDLTRARKVEAIKKYG